MDRETELRIKILNDLIRSAETDIRINTNNSYYRGYRTGLQRGLALIRMNERQLLDYDY